VQWQYLSVPRGWELGDRDGGPPFGEKLYTRSNEGERGAGKRHAVIKDLGGMEAVAEQVPVPQEGKAGVGTAADRTRIFTPRAVGNRNLLPAVEADGNDAGRALPTDHVADAVHKRVLLGDFQNPLRQDTGRAEEKDQEARAPDAGRKPDFLPPEDVSRVCRSHVNTYQHRSPLSSSAGHVSGSRTGTRCRANALRGPGRDIGPAFFLFSLRRGKDS